MASLMFTSMVTCHLGCLLACLGCLPCCLCLVFEHLHCTFESCRDTVWSVLRQSEGDVLVIFFFFKKKFKDVPFFSPTDTCPPGERQELRPVSCKARLYFTLVFFWWNEFFQNIYVYIEKTSTSVRGRSIVCLFFFFKKKKKRHSTHPVPEDIRPRNVSCKTIQIDARSPLHYPSTVFPPSTVHALDYKHVRNERNRILVTTHFSSMLTTHHKKERTQGPTRRPHFAPTHEALSSRNSRNIRPHTRRLLGSSQRTSSLRSRL